MIQKTIEATDDLIESKISNKNSPQNNSVTNEEEIRRERYLFLEERQKVIDDIRLI